jgi:hypothetical protein
MARTLDDYKLNPNMDDIERAADFLCWAADQFPGRPVPWRNVTKFAYAKKTLPKEGSEEVEAFRRNRVQRLKQVLFKKYHRALVSHASKGVRATTGSEDVAKYDIESKARRLVGATNSLNRSISLVNPKEIQNPDVKARFIRIAQVSRQLVSSDLLKRLELPPKRNDDGEENK